MDKLQMIEKIKSLVSARPSKRITCSIPLWMGYGWRNKRESYTLEGKSFIAWGEQITDLYADMNEDQLRECIYTLENYEYRRPEKIHPHDETHKK